MPPSPKGEGELPSHRRGGVREARGGDSSFNTPPPLPGTRPLKGWGAKKEERKKRGFGLSFCDPFVIQKLKYREIIFNGWLVIWNRFFTSLYFLEP